MLFQNVVLSWIIENNKHIKFEMNVEDSQFMDKVSWYNTNICKKLNGQSFEDYFRTIPKDRYEFICSVGEYVLLCCVYTGH